MAKSSKIVGPFRCVWPYLSEPTGYGDDPNQKKKYKLTLLIPKSDKAAVKMMQDFIKARIDENGAWKADQKKAIFNRAMKTVTDEGINNFCLLRDGDKLNEDRLANDKTPYEFFKDHYVISLSRPEKFGMPLVVGVDAKEIAPAPISNVIRSGYYVKAEISAYTYDKPKSGISLQFTGVQMWKKAEEFGKQNNFEAGEAEEENDESSFED